MDRSNLAPMALGFVPRECVHSGRAEYPRCYIKGLRRAGVSLQEKLPARTISIGIALPTAANFAGDFLQRPSEEKLIASFMI